MVPAIILLAGPCGAGAWNLVRGAEVVAPTSGALQSGPGTRSFGILHYRTARHRTSCYRSQPARCWLFDGWIALIMRPPGLTLKSTADFKAPERGKIAAQGYTIIANVGDQPSDLAGGFAERGFLVPNPFYRIP